MEGVSPEPQPVKSQAAPHRIQLAHDVHTETKEGVLMKRTMNRLIARLAMFVVAIILGAIAVAQAHRGLENRRKQGGTEDTQVASQPMEMPAQTLAQPIPIATSQDGAVESPTEYGDHYSDYAAYPSDVDPGFDSEPVAYQDSDTYRDAMGQPPTPIQEVRAVQHSPDAPSAYGDTQDPSAYSAEPQGYAELTDEPAPVTMQVAAAEEPAAAYDYAYEEEAMPPQGMDYGPPAPVAALAGGLSDPADAMQPAQYMSTPTPDSQPLEVDYDSPSPLNLPSQQPAASKPRGSDTVDPYQDSGYGGSASIMIGEQRTRPATPEYRAPSAPNPAFISPTTTGPPAMDDRARFADVPTTISPNYETTTDAQGNGKPGPKQLEGVQSPSLSLFKSSPAEVQVGKQATFTVTVRNVGSVAAHDVLIRDEVPHGAKLLETSPPAGRAADGALLWEMGTMEPGSEASVTMDIVPMEEGEIGSVATVSLQASASAKSRSTRPELVLQHTADRQILIGNDVIFRISLSNQGSGAATGVTLEEDVPSGLRHFDGRELEFPIGTLQPQEERVLELKLKADQPGPVNNVLVVRADGDIVVNDQCEFEVVAPALQVAIEGPRRRYLERRATHQIALANPGSAPAQNVTLVARLPRALKFINTNNAGQYDRQAHLVRWNLDELPANEMGKVELTTVPTEMGEHRIQVTTKADMGLEHAAEHEILVDGLAALLFTVTDVSDPIEVGGETTYEVHVVNQGSKTATNLRLMAAIPAGMQAINGDGPTRASIEGQQVVFDPLARLAPQSDSFYKIHVKGTSPGDQRVRVLLTSDELREPVTKEESTHVYMDE